MAQLLLKLLEGLPLDLFVDLSAASVGELLLLYQVTESQIGLVGVVRKREDQISGLLDLVRPQFHTQIGLLWIQRVVNTNHNHQNISSVVFRAVIGTIFVVVPTKAVANILCSVTGRSLQHADLAIPSSSGHNPFSLM